MFSTFDAVLQSQIDREARQACREFTPASMVPREQRGRTEQRVLVVCHDGSKRWVRKDADVIQLRKLIFGSVAAPGDLRVDMREGLEKARHALGLV